MTRYTRRIALLAAFSLVALLAVGAATASACGGVGGGQKGGASASAVVTAAAKQLNVTRVKLKTAIVDSANAYIDSEVESDDLDVDEAAQLKTRVEDDLAFAIATSRTKTVASNLGITVAALKDAFSAARKSLLTAKIDKALKNGDIDADQADEAKAELDDASLPGYKTVGRGGGFDLGSYTGGSSDRQSQQQQRRAFHR
jgi:hypothetical protein